MPLAASDIETLWAMIESLNGCSIALSLRRQGACLHSTPNRLGILQKHRVDKPYHTTSSSLMIVPCNLDVARKPIFVAKIPLSIAVGLPCLFLAIDQFDWRRIGELYAAFASCQRGILGGDVAYSNDQSGSLKHTTKESFAACIYVTLPVSTLQ